VGDKVTLSLHVIDRKLKKEEEYMHMLSRKW